MKTFLRTEKRHYLSRVLTVVLVASLIGAPTASYSQVLEEIIVSAQKRDENLQDVPVSVTAFSVANKMCLAAGYSPAQDSSRLCRARLVRPLS
jgi:hypothetical protein